MANKKVAIIGAGPAGASAAVQLARYGIEFDIYEKHKTGGLARNANRIENLIGFPNSISGLKYAKLLSLHFEKLNIKPVFQEVKNIEMDNESYVVNTNDSSKSYEYCIMATGTQANISDIEIPKELENSIFYEIADMPRVKKKHIIINGSGDAAFDYALNLAQSNKVTLICRNAVKALPLLVQRANASFNIEIRTNTTIKAFGKENEKNIVYCDDMNAEETIIFDYYIFAIGRHPILPNFGNADEISKNKKFFLIGDVKNGLYRQISISIGDGMRTAMEVYYSINGI